MDEMLGVIRIHIDVKNGDIVSFSKGSLMDMARFQKGNKK